MAQTAGRRRVWQFGDGDKRPPGSRRPARYSPADTTVFILQARCADVLVLADGDFRRVDGGSGDDHPRAGGRASTLDLTDATVRGRVRGIETLSLSDDGDGDLGPGD